MSMRRTAAAIAVLACTLSTGVRAGVFDGDALNAVAELRRQIERQNQDNDARFKQLDESIRNIGVIQLLQQIEGLNAEIARLRGQLEVVNNQNEQLQKRQHDFYVDLDTRLRRLEGGGTAAAATDAAPSAAGGATAAMPPLQAAPVKAGAAARDSNATELKAYDNAANLFKKGDYVRAVDTFNGFLRDYPSSQLAPNAQYWIGMSYFNLRDFRNAQTSQEALIKRFPDSPKVPDALLALASIQTEQGDAGSARNTLEDIIARYPGTEAAGKARTRLAASRR